MSYTEPKEIPYNVVGVYRILDANKVDIDIGRSDNDVRGRVSIKWRSEKEEADLILVYALKSVPECLHWDFQTRFEHGKLPRYCKVMGSGCGCAECR